MSNQTIEVSHPAWLSNFEIAWKGQAGDLCLLKRMAKSGKPTFAIAYNAEGFPQPLEDGPIWQLKEYVNQAYKGLRLARCSKKLIFTFKFRELIDLGLKTSQTGIDPLDPQEHMDRVEAYKYHKNQINSHWFEYEWTPDFGNPNRLP